MVDAVAKVNLQNFTAALRAKKAACQHTWPEILNHAARNVAFRAASFTPKGNASRIRSSLMRDPHLRYALTSILLKKKGIGTLKSPQFSKAVAKLVSRRASSAGYLRAAFANAVEQLGGSFRGSKFRGADGFANQASVERLIAQIVAITSQPTSAHAQGAERIGLDAVNKAIAYVAEDTLAYAQRKTAEATAK